MNKRFPLYLNNEWNFLLNLPKKSYEHIRGTNKYALIKNILLRKINT